MEKSKEALRTIGEVSRLLDVPTHVLRFWEKHFPKLQPAKRVGGRRYYRARDVELIRIIRDLLYKDGLTIKGVQKHLRKTKNDENAGKEHLETEELVDVLHRLRNTIGEAAERLRSVVADSSK